MYELQCLVIALLHIPLMNAALAITGQPCGLKNCSLNEFCNSFNNHCEKCEGICNDPSHNFDAQTCVKQCQDYLHDVRYGSSPALQDEIKQLQQQQKTNTILLVIILIVLLVICIVWAARFLRKKRLLSTCFFKKIKPTKAPVNNSQPVGNENLPPINIPIVRNGGEAVGIGANVLSVSGTDVSTMPTLTTPIHNRYPAENSTTEYSYDNAALQVTPSTEKPKGSETTF
ncbi:protein grindelwald [Hermetia illucens]|uniref:protein grindelwald n=1 Tax=Hermetia illucens TaxID=343691 RepID=UPI0018CC44FB|nr:protein grindelwald [Hermetia illucens]